jgi:TatA/E family protein of Tat protein translocase
MPWGLTPVHLIVILVIVLIVVGPGKLPDTGAAIGKALRGFKDAVDGNDQAGSSQHSDQAPAAQGQPLQSNPGTPPAAGYPPQYAQPLPQQYPPQPGMPQQAPVYPGQYPPQPYAGPQPNLVPPPGPTPGLGSAPFPAAPSEQPAQGQTPGTGSQEPPRR